MRRKVYSLYIIFPRYYYFNIKNYKTRLQYFVFNTFELCLGPKPELKKIWVDAYPMYVLLYQQTKSTHIVL